MAVVVLVAIVGAVAAIGARRRRTKHLRERFGPEYDRALERHGGRKQAETELTGRQERRQGLDFGSSRPSNASDSPSSGSLCRAGS